MKANKNRKKIELRELVDPIKKFYSCHSQLQAKSFPIDCVDGVLPSLFRPAFLQFIIYIDHSQHAEYVCLDAPGKQVAIHMKCGRNTDF